MTFGSFSSLTRRRDSGAPQQGGVYGLLDVTRQPGEMMYKVVGMKRDERVRNTTENTYLFRHSDEWLVSWCRAEPRSGTSSTTADH